MGPTELIPPEQIPAWIPGELTLDSAGAGGSMPFRVERDIKLDVWSTRLIGAWPRRTAMPADE